MVVGQVVARRRACVRRRGKVGLGRGRRWGSGAVASLILPALSVATALKLCAPSVSAAAVKIHFPVPSAIVVPRTAEPFLIAIIAPASAVPVRVGVRSPVRLSVLERPVSEFAARSGAPACSVPSYRRPSERL